MSEPVRDDTLLDEVAELAADLREHLRALAGAGAEALPRAPRAWSQPAEDEAPAAPRRSAPQPPPQQPARRAEPAASRPRGEGRPPEVRAEAPRGAPPPQATSGGGAWSRFRRAPSEYSAEGREAAVGAWGFGGHPPELPAGSPAAEAADALARVREDLGDCTRCGLCQGRTHLVFGMGNPDADLVVVGEGPGAQEDRQGLPFVGPSGEMLDKMLQHVLGLDRRQVYICNVVKCRPPNNRTPEPAEIEACSPFLLAQISAIRPKILLAMGRPAAQTLLRTERGINALRGTWQVWGPERIPMMATYHPAYLLRRPEDKRKAMDDLVAVRRRYDELGGRR